MTIRQRVSEAFSGVGIPIFFGGWAPKKSGDTPPAVYMTFTAMTRPNTYADNRQVGWRQYVYLNLWASSPYAAQRQAVLEAMESAGFSVVDITEDYEENTRMNRCAFTLFYLEVD